MKKLFCDCCEKEVGTLNKVKFKTHIKEVFSTGINLAGKYVDSDGNLVSGKYEVIELCNKCYNDVMYEMYSRFKELKKE